MQRITWKISFHNNTYAAWCHMSAPDMGYITNVCALTHSRLHVRPGLLPLLLAVSDGSGTISCPYE